ncbi:MAG: DUF2442 domain-containing protein [Chloroflexi bacterium]|nr:DUF2442 domain-containing protein [Chloroflexota bacterium]
MDKAHDVRKVSFYGKRMRLLVDGREYEIDISEHSKKLANASPEQKRHFVISPSGYGIHWPELDEDLSIDGLIGVSHARPVVKTAR